MVIWPRRRKAAYPAAHLAWLKSPIPKPDELLGGFPTRGTTNRLLRRKNENLH